MDVDGAEQPQLPQAVVEDLHFTQ